MSFGSMNDYQQLKSRRWLGMPHRASCATGREMLMRALVACVVAASIGAVLLH